MKKPVFGEPKFSVREKRVFALFWRKGFKVDISIDKMYLKYHDIDVPKNHKLIVPTPRQQQMSIGMVVTRINRKLKGTKIVPGALKRTYRLTICD